MMDGDQLREELRKRIAQEVHAQFSAYRGAVSAELTFMDQELDTGLRAVQDKFASVGAEILESHAARVTRGIERGPIRTASPDVWASRISARGPRRSALIRWVVSLSAIEKSSSQYLPGVQYFLFGGATRVY